MDSMEVNKTIAAVLVAGIVFFLTGFIGVNLVNQPVPEEVAFKIDMPTATSGGAPAAPAPLPPVSVLLAKADPGRGEAAVKKEGCVACHTFTEGGKNGIGPNLYGVVGEPIGQGKDFTFSAALSAKKGDWTYPELNEWLAKPSAFAPGTKMTFVGVKDNQERADIIDYLHTLSHSPVPLPTPTAEELNPPAAPAPAAGGQAAAAPPPPSVGTLLASADPAAGESDTKKQGCVACHTFNQGGRNGIGPNLYGVVGAPIAEVEGFTFSNALKEHHGNWSYDELDKWLTKPAAFAPGTRMTFVGVADPKARADIIDYLRTLSPNPQPLPAK
jgi:cytochrome c